ncbi:MAG: peptide-methionine (S)-S-oxide reductase MsrA [Porticoccus sp.]|nr:peptide-methionine (S)-S-oxide reductase MsrA [Porticoccus sp.]
MFGQNKNFMVTAAEAIPGRAEVMPVNSLHYEKGHCIIPPFPVGMQEIVLGLGCFWGAERRFWIQPGVYTTAVGYAGGYTKNPTYDEVCSGLTGHTEVVKVVFDPSGTNLQQLLNTFWEAHDPTQGMRQGNDQGTQYRSAIYCSSEEQLNLVLQSRDGYQNALDEAGFAVPITTEIAKDQTFYYAEEYHQQYLAKNPNGYCGLRGTGVSCA